MRDPAHVSLSTMCSAGPTKPKTLRGEPRALLPPGMAGILDGFRVLALSLLPYFSCMSGAGKARSGGEEHLFGGSVSKSSILMEEAEPNHC